MFGQPFTQIWDIDWLRIPNIHHIGNLWESLGTCSWEPCVETFANLAWEPGLETLLGNLTGEPSLETWLGKLLRNLAWEPLGTCLGTPSWEPGSFGNPDFRCSDLLRNLYYYVGRPQAYAVGEKCRGAA